MSLFHYKPKKSHRRIPAWVKYPHIHHAGDYRGARQVLLNGKPVSNALLAFTGKRGFVRIAATDRNGKIRVNKGTECVITKVLRGHVKVRYL